MNEMGKNKKKRRRRKKSLNVLAKEFTLFHFLPPRRCLRIGREIRRESIFCSRQTITTYQAINLSICLKSCGSFISIDSTHNPFPGLKAIQS